VAGEALKEPAQAEGEEGARAMKPRAPKE
jgi:hypothetical protein